MSETASGIEELEAFEGGAPAERLRSRPAEVWSAVVANRLAVVGLVVLGLLVVAAVIGPTIAPFGINEQNITNRFAGPSRDHWFGTDDLGRDVFSRVLVASRGSLQVGAVAVGIALGLGVPIGLVAGFYGGLADGALMRLMDIVFSFPAILLAIAIVAVRGPGLLNAMIAIGIVYMPIFARITRGSVISVRNEVYVRAARSLGASGPRIMRRHVLPNVVGPIIVQTSLSLAFAILSEAALSFLGLGVQPPQPSWGRMLADGRGFMKQAPWIGIFPGLAIVATVMAFNLVGDGLRDALDPRQKSIIESRGQQA
ncbi:ABC transporter permease [Desertimonas flava]|uniref:ABC transporter permease n=1 Tax=Desertimonas flava TaxID=2064846 RepID=UPI000E344D01|nr:ABC transporter permease [Desertimonas flava]